jgi:hypothetical protein
MTPRTLLKEEQYLDQLIETSQPVNIYFSNGVKLANVTLIAHSGGGDTVYIQQAGREDDLVMVNLFVVASICPVPRRRMDAAAVRELKSAVPTPRARA